MTDKGEPSKAMTDHGAAAINMMVIGGGNVRKKESGIFIFSSEKIIREREAADF